jgi:hypothetical protein
VCVYNKEKKGRELHTDGKTICKAREDAHCNRMLEHSTADLMNVHENEIFA